MNFTHLAAQLSALNVPIGDAPRRRVLTDSEVQALRRHRNLTGESLQATAKRYGIAKATAWSICSRRTRSGVTA